MNSDARANTVIDECKRQLETWPVETRFGFLYEAAKIRLAKVVANANATSHISIAMGELVDAPLELTFATYNTGGNFGYTDFCELFHKMESDQIHIVHLQETDASADALRSISRCAKAFGFRLVSNATLDRPANLITVSSLAITKL